MGAWGGYSNGAIPQSAMIRVQSSYFKPEVAYALADAIAECKANGIGITVNEGYRPLGVPNDASIRTESATSTHSSNQWFQYGRMKRGETPAAAYPGSSNHGWGTAVDCNPGRQNATVNKIFIKHGFSFDIASEVWHADFVGGSTPPSYKWMVPSTALQKSIQHGLQRLHVYSGAADGVWGPNTIKGIQQVSGVVADGVPGANTVKAVQQFAKTYGKAGSPIDMVLNEAWWSHFNAGLAVK